VVRHRGERIIFHWPFFLFNIFQARGLVGYWTHQSGSRRTYPLAPDVLLWESGVLLPSGGISAKRKKKRVENHHQFTYSILLSFYIIPTSTESITDTWCIIINNANCSRLDQFCTDLWHF
jgi:hypothetical protein